MKGNKYIDMSEHVRTEHGIFELDEFGCIRHPANGMRIHISYIKDHRVADTIGDLCDAFVWKDEVLFGTYKEIKAHWFLVREEIRGAIWTDKGLIYVAKMNEKGELELI